MRKTRLLIIVVLLGGVAVGANVLVNRSMARKVSLLGLMEIGDDEGVDWVLRWDPAAVGQLGEVEELYFDPFSWPARKTATPPPKKRNISPLRFALERGNGDLFMRMLRLRGALPESEHELLLKRFVQLRDREIVRLLLETPAMKDDEVVAKGKVVVISGGLGRTAGPIPALHHAVLAGDTEIIAMMIEHGNVNQKDDEGRTPLHLACEYGTTKTVAYLLDNGADLEATDEDGTRPVHFAFNRPKVLALLIQRGADVNVATQNRRTPLHAAAEHGSVACAKTLLNAGALQVPDKDGETPLHLAVKRFRQDMVGFLLEAGADPNAKATSNDTPIIYACGGWLVTNRKRIMEALLDAGARAEARSAKGETVLTLVAASYAIRHTMNAISDEGGSFADTSIALLIRRGADVNAQNANGQTVYDIAVKAKWTEPALKWLQQQGAMPAGKLETAERRTSK